MIKATKMFQKLTTLQVTRENYLLDLLKKIYISGGFHLDGSFLGLPNGSDNKPPPLHLCGF
jgi:hypothetical protein